MNNLNDPSVSALIALQVDAAIHAERERVLRLLEAEISALPTNLYVASKLARAIARIRKGEP